MCTNAKPQPNIAEYATSNLLVANAVSGLSTQIGTMSAPDVTGLAYNVNSSIMYASSIYYNSISDQYESSLYTVDLETAATELVGTSLDDGLIIGIACDAEGNLYGIDLIGSLGIDINYAQDIAYDRDNNILYGTLYTSSGGLYTIDVSTGAATLLLDFVAKVTGFAIPYSLSTEYTVTFTVTNENSSPLNGANININGTNLTTVGGEASIMLENGSYNYIVTLGGYYGENSTVVVDGADVSENVTLTKVPGVLFSFKTSI